MMPITGPRVMTNVRRAGPVMAPVRQPGRSHAPLANISPIPTARYIDQKYQGLSAPTGRTQDRRNSGI